MNTTTEIRNCGQVKQMSLPDGWIEVPDKQRDQFDLRSLRKFVHPSNSDVQLCLYHRGTPVTDDSAERLQDLLDDDRPHLLSPQELLRVQQVLGDFFIEEAFHLLSARVETINKRKVLEVKGRWKQQNLDTICIFTQVAEAPALIQEIYYVAPVAEYSRHLPLATAAINSIVWND